MHADIAEKFTTSLHYTGAGMKGEYAKFAAREFGIDMDECYLDTRKGTQPVPDEFYLGVASDGKIKPFVKMEAIYDNASHIGYGEWFSHTVTDKAKDCAFCHEKREVLCEGCEGEILGQGGSFIPQETIDKVLAVEMPVATPAETPVATPAATPTPPGFELIFAVMAIAVVVYLAKRRH